MIGLIAEVGRKMLYTCQHDMLRRCHLRRTEQLCHGGGVNFNFVVTYNIYCQPPDSSPTLTIMVLKTINSSVQTKKNTERTLTLLDSNL